MVCSLEWLIKLRPFSLHPFSAVQKRRVLNPKARGNSSITYLLLFLNMESSQILFHRFCFFLFLRPGVMWSGRQCPDAKVKTRAVDEKC